MFARYQGLTQMDLVIVALALGLAGLAACSLIFVLIRTLLFMVWLRNQEERSFVLTAETEQQRSTEFAPPALSWIPFVQLSWKWSTPRADVEPFWSEGRLQEACLFRERGLHDQVERTFLIEDLFGLAKIRLRRRSPAHIKVLPHYGRLLEPPLLIRLSSGDEISDPRGEPVGDRVDMRQYVRGDAPRTILWKVFARTRRLMVRIPERALAARPRVCCYLVCGEGDEASAALARIVLEKHLLGQGWRFGCDDQPGFDEHVQPALERIARSGNRHPERESGCQLGEFLQQAQKDGYAQCMLLLPPRLGDKSTLVTQAVIRTALAVTVCLTVDGVVEETQAARWKRWLYFTQGDSHCTPEDLREAAKLWGHHNGDVMLVDRKAGVMLGDLRSYQRQKGSRSA